MGRCVHQSYLAKDSIYIHMFFIFHHWSKLRLLCSKVAVISQKNPSSFLVKQSSSKTFNTALASVLTSTKPASVSTTPICVSVLASWNSASTSASTTSASTSAWQQAHLPMQIQMQQWTGRSLCQQTHLHWFMPAKQSLLTQKEEVWKQNPFFCIVFCHLWNQCVHIRWWSPQLY